MARRLDSRCGIEVPGGQFGLWSYWFSSGLGFAERGDAGAPGHPPRHQVLCLDGRYAVLRSEESTCAGAIIRWFQWINADGQTSPIMENDATASLKRHITAYMEALGP